MSGKITILDDDSDLDDDIPAEIDFSKATYDKERTEQMRARARERAGLVRLDADVAAFFRSEAAINAVLRRAMELALEVEQGRKEAA